MNNKNNEEWFIYLNEVKKTSKNKLINLGILINSGGIVGILTISKGIPEGNLKFALSFFIMSICTIFLAELITMKMASNSLTQIIKKDP